MIAKALSLGLLLLSAVFFPIVFSPAVAQEEQPLTVETSASEYELEDTVRISGNVGNYIPQVALEIKWVKPDSKIISDLVEPLSDGSYEASLRLQSNEVTGGKWRVDVSFDNKNASAMFVVKDPYIEVQIVNDKEGDGFVHGEQVRIEGKIIRKINDEDKITVRILTAKGNLFQSSEIKLDVRDFDYSFTLEGPKVSYGQWFIDVRYISGHRTALPFDVVPSPVSVYVNKELFLPGDSAWISGNVNASVISDRKFVVLTVTSPDNQVFNSTSVDISANGSFIYKLDLFGSSATKFGDWKVVAKYGIHNGVTSFEVSEPDPLITVEVSKESYGVGETVKVSGRTASLGSEVSIHFYIAGSQLLKKYAPVPVNDNYTYNYELVPDNDFETGVYDVLVTHNGEEATTSFMINSSVPYDKEPRLDKVVVFALKPKSSNGAVLTTIPTGQQTLLSATLANENNKDIFFTGLIEIRNNDGITEYIGSKDGLVVKKGFATFGMEWSPGQPGTYEARIFLLTSLTDPRILSPVVTSELVIDASSA